MSATVHSLPAATLPVVGSMRVRVDRIYGNLTVYPADQRSEILARIAGTKTLTLDALADARRLGFEIEFAEGSSAEMAGRLTNLLAVVRVRP